MVNCLFTFGGVDGDGDEHHQIVDCEHPSTWHDVK